MRLKSFIHSPKNKKRFLNLIISALIHFYQNNRLWTHKAYDDYYTLMRPTSRPFIPTSTHRFLPNPFRAHSTIQHANFVRETKQKKKKKKTRSTHKNIHIKSH